MTLQQTTPREKINFGVLKRTRPRVHPAMITSDQRWAALNGLQESGDEYRSALAKREQDHAMDAGTYTYDDISSPKGRARGYDQEQAATAACDGGDARSIGTPAFNACMRSNGWRFAHFTPQTHDDGQDQRDENAANAARLDGQMRNDDFIRNLNSQP
jgi:hypothetical protein